jgi:trimeric autotransporter adhesin
MIYEDKILDYLDGALGDKDSAELMHQLSVSPERRVILEQHLQLKNAISDARKPVSVPASIEANLAERLPIIANYNRELSGAALIGTSARAPIFGRVAAGIAVLLLLGTTAYFGVIRNGNDNSDQSTTSTTISNSNSNTASSSDVTPTPQSTVTTNTLSSSSNSTIQATTSGSVTNVPTRSSGGSASRQHLSASSQDLNSAAVPPTAHSEQVQTEKLIQQEVPAAETTQLQTISVIDDLRTEPMAALSYIGERSNNTLMHALLEQSSSVPFALRADYSLGSGLNQVRETDASITTRTAYNLSLGLDYIMSPSFAIGIEAGQTDVARVEETATVTEDKDLGITRVIISHDIRTHAEYNVRAIFRYTFNPYDRGHIDGNIGFGVASGENTSSLVSVGVTFTSSLTDAISLTVGPTWTGMFTKSTSAAAVTADGPVAYSVSDQAASTLFTPSFMVKAGLRIKPW